MGSQLTKVISVMYEVHANSKWDVANGQCVEWKKRVFLYLIMCKNLICQIRDQIITLERSEANALTLEMITCCERLKGSSSRTQESRIFTNEAESLRIMPNLYEYGRIML